MQPTLRAVLFALCFVSTSASGVAKHSDDDARAPYLTCWPTPARPAYAQRESALLALPSPDRLRQWHELVASEPHIAGTPGDLRQIDRLVKAFTDMGLEVERHEFHPYLCRPVTAIVEVADAGSTIPLLVKEDLLAQDAATSSPDQTFGWNAYSGSGEVTAPVVFANYGTKADFAKLAELGVDCHGKVVIARYGGNYRGFKARFAEDAGAAALIIYTDPADAGYMKGIPYPEGGWANSTCIERGSILGLPYPGDPLTPGREATQAAERLDPKSLALPRIPVQPLGYQAAGEILRRMTGAAVPAGWQGGLPCAYRLTGGDALKVHVKVRQDRFIGTTANVVATLRGGSEPDRKVIIGCHHDAWGCGASDPTCGLITVLETARAFAERARAGDRPARTLVFCAWGAEEFGIIGSTEWVESRRDELVREAVAYINLDMASMGPDFGSSAAPALRTLIADAARSVPAARDATGKTVFQSWNSRATDPLFAGLPSFGDVGGGSDHVAFYCYAGIPSCGMGGSGAAGTAYHSIYDTLPWYWKAVGEDYAPALMVTRMTATVASRLAGAPLLPLDSARVGTEARRQLVELAKRGRELGLFPPDTAPPLARLEGAAAEYASRAATIQAAVLEKVAAGSLTQAQLRGINDQLMALDRAWLNDQGVPGRPWFKSMLAATDEDSGYAPWVLPALRHAVEHRDAAAVESAEDLYLSIFRHLTEIEGAIEAAAK